MENLDVMVLRTLRGWRAAGRRALLATVVRTWGSSPRPVGSMMALREDGRAVGSVSGGCIEDDLIARFTRSLPGAPDGDYVLLQNDARFQNKAAAIETVTMSREADGVWRVVGYFIR